MSDPKRPGAEIPAGWSWSRTDDAYGPVWAAWREVPESVHLEARSVGDLADEIGVYEDSLQASFEIAHGRGRDPVWDDLYGGAA